MKTIASKCKEKVWIKAAKIYRNLTSTFGTGSEFPCQNLNLLTATASAAAESASASSISFQGEKLLNCIQGLRADLSIAKNDWIWQRIIVISFNVQPFFFTSSLNKTKTNAPYLLRRSNRPPTFEVTSYDTTSKYTFRIKQSTHDCLAELSRSVIILQFIYEKKFYRMFFSEKSFSRWS